MKTKHSRKNSVSTVLIGLSIVASTPILSLIIVGALLSPVTSASAESPIIVKSNLNPPLSPTIIAIKTQQDNPPLIKLAPLETATPIVAKNTPTTIQYTCFGTTLSYTDYNTLTGKGWNHIIANSPRCIAPIK